MTHIISVVNQKGGVGKTTTTVSVAACLAELKYKVLLIDLDPQGHTTESIGINGEFDSSKTVLEVLGGELKAADGVLPTYLENLFIIPANLRLGKYNQNLPEGKQMDLKNNLEPIVEDYDFILIDCQPSLSLLTLNSLTASSHILLPVQSEFLALDGLTQLILTIKEVKLKLNPGLSVLGIALTMFDRRNKLSGEIRWELNRNFGDDLFNTVIPRNVKLAEAPSFGRAIINYAPFSEGARSYRKLTKEIVKKLDN